MGPDSTDATTWEWVVDLAGIDPKQHNGTQKEVVESVVGWLATREKPTFTPINPRRVMKCLPNFQAEMEELKGQWGAEVPWWAIIESARRAVPVL
jgi:hypothetical protein